MIAVRDPATRTEVYFSTDPVHCMPVEGISGAVSVQDLADHDSRYSVEIRTSRGAFQLGIGITKERLIELLRDGGYHLEPGVRVGVTELPRGGKA